VLLSESSKSYLHDTVYCDEDVKSNFDQTFLEQLLVIQHQHYPVNRITYAFITSKKPRRIYVKYVHFRKLSTALQRKYGYDEMLEKTVSNHYGGVQCIKIAKEWRILHRTKKRDDGSWILFYYLPGGSKST
jgi:hypothetical protein